VNRTSSAGSGCVFRLAAQAVVGATLCAGCGSSDTGSGLPGDAGHSDGTPSGSDGSSLSDGGHSAESAEASSNDSSSDVSSTGFDSSAGDGGMKLDSGWGTAVDGGPGFSGPTVAGTVSVNRSTPAGVIGPGFAGFSFEKTHMTNGTFTGTNAALIALFNLVGPTVLRIGADDVDNCTWVPSALPGGGAPPYSKSIGTVDVDDLGDLLKATGAKVIYGVNFHSDDPPNSAAEAAYVTTTLGSSLYGFEIGNEINRYGSWASLQSEWQSFATAIHAIVPGAPLIGPAAGGGDALSLTTPFAADEGTGEDLILLTQHYYAGTAGTDTATVTRLLTVDPDPPTSQDGLIGTLTTTNTAAVTNKIPDGFRLGECNTFSAHGESGVNFHGGEAGMDGNTPFYYSPITETNGVVTDVAPLYYGMLLFTLAGSGQGLATTAIAGSLDFTAYAVELADGSTSVVLNNKDSTNGVQATVDVGAAVGSASAIYLLGPTPASLTAMTGITIAGADITPAGEWNRNPPYALKTSGNTVSVLVPPASAALVRAQ
jgi:hypothetical protein